MFKNLRKKKKGFTLIELIIVIAILAILAAVALPRLGNVTGDAKIKADIANAKTIANAVSILEAEDKIKTDLDNPVEVGSVPELVEYLQSVPTPSTSDTESFEVSIDEDEDVIKVFVGDTEFFPNPPEDEE